MKKTFIVFILIFIGCSRPPEPITLDSSPKLTINESLITQKLQNVPNDPFLKNNNWAYSMYLSPIDNNTLIRNDLVVKTFYLAHNADKIIIAGFEPTAQKYKKYFVDNEVEANIEIQPLDMIDFRKDIVNILFFHKKNKEKK